MALLSSDSAGCSNLLIQSQQDQLMISERVRRRLALQSQGRGGAEPDGERDLAGDELELAADDELDVSEDALEFPASELSQDKVKDR